VMYWCTSGIDWCRSFARGQGSLSCQLFFFFFQAEDGIRDWSVTGVQTCALPILLDVALDDPASRSRAGNRIQRHTAIAREPARERRRHDARLWLLPGWLLLALTRTWRWRRGRLRWPPGRRGRWWGLLRRLLFLRCGLR